MNVASMKTAALNASSKIKDAATSDTTKVVGIAAGATVVSLGLLAAQVWIVKKIWNAM